VLRYWQWSKHQLAVISHFNNYVLHLHYITLHYSAVVLSAFVSLLIWWTDKVFLPINAADSVKSVWYSAYRGMHFIGRLRWRWGAHAYTRLVSCTVVSPWDVVTTIAIAHLTWSVCHWPVSVLQHLAQCSVQAILYIYMPIRYAIWANHMAT